MVKQIGIYRANITPIDRLIKTTIGRQIMLDDLIEKLGQNVGKKGGQHYLFIGPRGIGKTHFISLIENMVLMNTELKKNYTVIRFPEENNRILSFADFLINIIGILGENMDDNEWRKTYNELYENEKDEEIIDTIVPRLRNYQKKTGKTFLLLIENLDILFTQQIKQKQDIHRLRSFLMDSPCATLIGTSPVYFPDLYNTKSPIYEFFDIQILEDLNEEQTLEMICKNLEWDKRDDIIKDFDSMIPKIKTLHIMTGGNPRLIIMLYELIANDNILEVKMQFQKLLDQISPFYQDRMKDLAPHERAILETIALMRREPRTPANIAKCLRKSPQQISSLLNRMTKAGYITVLENPEDKRSRVYKIKEGFFDLWLAMSESRVQNKKLGYLVDFFEIYYKDKLEREKKRINIWQQLEEETGQTSKKENCVELLEHLSEVGEPSERYQTKIELAIHKLKEGDIKKANHIFSEIETIAPKESLLIWMNKQAHRWMEGVTDIDIQKWLDDMIEYWRIQRSGDFEKAVEIAHKLGNDMSNKGLHKIRIDLLTNALNITKNLKEKYLLYIEIAESQKMNGMLSEALVSLQNALEISGEVKSIKEAKSLALNNISQIYFAKGDYNTTLKYLEDSLKISKKIKDSMGEGVSLNNIGLIYSKKGDYDMALKYFEDSMKIRKEIGDRQGESVTINNIGIVYSAKNDYDMALKYFEDSMKIKEEVNDKEGQIATLHNITVMKMKKGNLDKLEEIARKAYKLSVETGNVFGLFNVGKILGEILYRSGQQEEGIKILHYSYKIGRSSPFPGTDNIRNTLLKLGEKIE